MGWCNHKIRTRKEEMAKLRKRCVTTELHPSELSREAAARSPASLQPPEATSAHSIAPAAKATSCWIAPGH